MLRIHMSDGSTLKVDLADEEQAARWVERLRDIRFQAEIRGVTVHHRGVQYSLPRPQGFPTATFITEYLSPDADRKMKGGERISCFAGDVRISMMVHHEQRAARVSVSKSGRQRYNPILNGRS